MKISKTKLMIGGLILVFGVILAVPVFADTEDEQTTMPPLYYLDEETGEYLPWYPRWYDPENPEFFSQPEECPYWDYEDSDEFDWMPHWGRRWSNPEENGEYGYRRGGCGGYGYRSYDGIQPN